MGSVRCFWHRLASFRRLILAHGNDPFTFPTEDALIGKGLSMEAVFVDLVRSSKVCKWR